MSSFIQKLRSIGQNIQNQAPLKTISKSKEPNTEIAELGLRKTRLLIYIFSTIIFGISALLFIVGILYLTVYFYKYSFTAFSTTLCAALYITFAGLLLIIIGLNVFLIRSGRNHLVILTTIGPIILFIVLLAIGIWGSSVSSSDDLSLTIRRNIRETTMYYNENNPNDYATAKIDWLQRKFSCCGIDSSQDWREYFLYGRGSGAGVDNHIYQQHPNQNLYGTQVQQQQQGIVNQQIYANPFNANINVPYIDTVPDSCCVKHYYNCGKEGNRRPNSGNMYGQNYLIYTQGCLSWYVQRYTRDLVFVAGFTVAVSVLGLVACLAFIGLYVFIKKRSVYN